MKMSIGMLRQMKRATMTAPSLGAPNQDNRERRDLLCCIIDRRLRVIVGSLAQAAEYLHDVVSQKHGQDRVKDHRRPQQETSRNTHETDICKIQRDQGAVSPHADE